MAMPIVIPRLGWSMEQGTFAGWLKAEGDQIRAGDALFQLEGDKALQDVEAIDAGVLRISPSGPGVGQVVLVGAVIGAVGLAGETIDWSEWQASEAKKSPEQLVAPTISNVVLSATPTAFQTEARPSDSSENERQRTPAGPAVRRLARSLKVDLDQIQGSGPRGRLTSADVQRDATRADATRVDATRGDTGRGDANSSTHSGRVRTNTNRADAIRPDRVIATPRARRAAALQGIDLSTVQGSGAGGRIRERDLLQTNSRRASVTQKPASQLPAFQSRSGKRVPITTRRRVIAERMQESRDQTVPVTLTTRADATGLVELRRQFTALGDSQAIPSYQDIILKLAAELLPADPWLAGCWDDDAIVIPDESGWHLGFAVDTELGLLVPVIRDVRDRSLREIAAESKRLIEKARAGRLTLDEMQGSVFTVTNLGAFGIDAFTPVIRWPEASILGLGAIRREAMVMQDDSIEIRSMITLSLTFDHRVLDGAPAARFLQRLVRAIENPSAALLS